MDDRELGKTNTKHHIYYYVINLNDPEFKSINKYQIYYTAYEIP